MPDTLFDNVSATSQAMLQRAEALMPQEAPCMNLVTRVPIRPGFYQADLPYATSVATVQTPTEGDEIVFGDTFTFDFVSITPGIKVIKYKISKRAERFSQEQLVSFVGSEISRAQAQNIDELIVAQFPNFHTDNDVGTTNTDILFSVLSQARNNLRKVAVLNGGPAPLPIACVLGPTPQLNLMTDLGAQGVVSGAAPWIEPGMSADIMKQFAIPGGDLLGGVSIVWDGYMTENSASDFICAMFAKKAIGHAVSQEWNSEVFRESDWLGVILRADADYGVGMGPFSHWGCQITADGD